MLRPSDEAILDAILASEGGFVNDPDDAGGPTNFGITGETLGDWLKLNRPANVEEVRALDTKTARDIYAARYIIGPGFDDILSDRLRYLVVDMWVNHGPTSATKIVQRARRLPVDGIMGPATHQSLVFLGNSSGETFMLGYNAILAERIRFYGRIITRNPTQAKFAADWFDRAADFLSPN